MDARCPRKLQTLPKDPCPEGREAVAAEKRGEHGGCAWFVNDAESGYCFFRYMAQEGRPVEPARIARLLMIHDDEVKDIVNKFKKTIQQDE